MIVKEYLWVLEVAFQCWLEHSSVFTALSYPPWLPLGLEPNPWVDLSLLFLVHTSTAFSPLEIGQWLPSVLSPHQLFEPMDFCTPAFPVHQQLINLRETHVLQSWVPSNHVILCRPLLLLPSIFLNIWVFSDESVLRISWPKYWSFSFNISPFSEHSGLMSFRIDWIDLLPVPGTFKSHLQHHGSKASNLWHWDFLMVQLSHPYMTTRKSIALNRWSLSAK